MADHSSLKLAKTLTADPKVFLAKAKRIVIKIGSSILADPQGGLKTAMFRELAAVLKTLAQQKLELIVVSSGAIACGMKRLGFGKRPKALSELQACAAIGQVTLMEAYENALKPETIIAQLLLTREDFEARERFLNVRSTLKELLKRGVVPIINENDTVTNDEIKFGDNDTLAALVASLAEADLLLLLTDCDGLYTANPRHDPTATRIPLVTNIDAKTHALAGDAGGETRVGGMATKIKAAQIAGRSGIATVIASGEKPKVISNILSGADVGTWFLPSVQAYQSRKHWLVFHVRPLGRLTIDAGAVDALLKKRKSLLPSGIVAITGNFSVGDPVDVIDPSGQAIARGLVAYNARELTLIQGRKTQELEKLLGYRGNPEAIHRDNLALLLDGNG